MDLISAVSALQVKSTSTHLDVHGTKITAFFEFKKYTQSSQDPLALFTLQT